MTSLTRQAQFVTHLMLGKLLDPPVQPHEQEVFDELAREGCCCEGQARA